MDSNSANELRILTGKLNLIASRIVRNPSEKIRLKAAETLQKTCLELDALTQYKSNRKKKTAARFKEIDTWRIGN